jgi:hypothetical protein
MINVANSKQKEAQSFIIKETFRDFMFRNGDREEE